MLSIKQLVFLEFISGVFTKVNRLVERYIWASSNHDLYEIHI